MKKDIIIPKVNDVHIAIMKEWNEDFSSNDWNIYLINNSKEAIESVMVMSRGKHSDGRKTTTFRQAFPVVAAKSAIKVELIMEEVFSFTNEIILTYFKDNKLYDKTFTAAPHTIKEDNFEDVPIMGQKGILLN
ncbi:hypothetical protein [Nonlabens ulvanivorans]|uniref:hypothetical protein n=1 Tax=Nonlabens ulvanivorans TaxID=906888 RepID=UPI0037C92748